MTKNELIENLVAKVNTEREKKNADKAFDLFTKTECEFILDSFAEVIKACLLNGDKIVLKNFMSFEVSTRPERKGRNPKTGDITTFPAVKSIKCKLSKVIKDAVNAR